MKTTIAILAIAFLAVTPAAAKSLASKHAPGHQAKGVHGHSYWAPGHHHMSPPGYYERH
jgi:hypothetical protein